jgi:hypothetical protein
MAASQPLDPAAALPIPELYEPVLPGFAPFAFRLRGFDRMGNVPGSYSVVQEWHCVLP